MTSPDIAVPPVALVTGGSRGLGRALVTRLLADGWQVITDGRDPAALAALGTPQGLTAIPGDVADPSHREELATAAVRLGRPDLVVSNASTLGPTPLRPLAQLLPQEYEQVLAVAAVAPFALVTGLLPVLRRSAGRVVAVSSDAAVEAYPGWGPYGSAKAAFDRLLAVLAVEEPALRVYSVDPGEMGTRLYAAADPDADLASMPTPESVVPALIALLSADLPSGRYRAADLVATAVTA